MIESRPKHAVIHLFVAYNNKKNYITKMEHYLDYHKFGELLLVTLVHDTA
jgi:hypothetical protein